MPRFNAVHEGLKLLPVDFDKQIQVGSFEHALCYLVDHEMDLSALRGRYKNDEQALPPTILGCQTVHPAAGGLRPARLDRPNPEGNRHLHPRQRLPLARRTLRQARSTQDETGPAARQDGKNQESRVIQSARFPVRSGIENLHLPSWQEPLRQRRQLHDQWLPSHQIPGRETRLPTLQAPLATPAHPGQDADAASVLLPRQGARPQKLYRPMKGKIDSPKARP